MELSVTSVTQARSGRVGCGIAAIRFGSMGTSCRIFVVTTRYRRICRLATI